MLKFGHNFGQIFRPSKTNLNSGRVVLWFLNCPSKWDPKFKQKRKKNKGTKKNDNNTKPKASFCRKKRFLKNGWKKICFSVGLGLLAFLRPKTCKDHSATKNNKTRGFVVICVVFSLVGVSQTTTTTIKTKTSNDNKTATMGPRDQAKQKKNRNTQKTTRPNQRTNNTMKWGLVFFLCCFFFVCCCPNNQNKTTKPQHNKTTNKQQKQMAKTLANKVN